MVPVKGRSITGFLATDRIEDRIAIKYQEAVMEFADKTLTCRECGTEFTFTAGEQEFFQSRGLLNEPGRCPQCRAARRRGFPSRAEREYHDIVCDSCGQEARVPFQPRGDRPVYCNDCFAKMRNER